MATLRAFASASGGPGGTISHGSAVLQQSGAGGLDPSFVVPADFFYALAANMPTHVSAEQRYGSDERDSRRMTKAGTR